MINFKEYCKNALKIQPPKDIINLTVNFRSHNFILQLANSIISSIQNLFPGSIDKIRKQKSDLLGPKPYILINQPRDLLFYLICGPNDYIKQEEISQQTHLRQIILQSQEKEAQNFKENAKKKKKKNNNRNQDQPNSSDEDQQIETRKFNSEQIIIVRNIEEKLKLPASLRRGIILTPQNAKGLQFDEVILYNFFSSCPIYQKWSHLFQHLEPQYLYQSQKEYEEQLSRRNKQEKQIDQPIPLEIKVHLGYDEEKKSYKQWNLKAKESIKGVTINLYHELANQLKILYTVITRARSVFVIYDSKIPKNLLKIWEKMNLVTLVDESNAPQCHKQINHYVKSKQKHIKYINQNALWFKAGSQMLARKDYDNAKKCFKNIQRFDLVDRIQALQLQIKAQNQLFHINNQIKNLSNLSRVNKKIAKIRLEKEREQTLKFYITAAQIYEKYNRYNDAAQAYLKGQQYQISLKYFKRINRMQKIAICCKKLGLYNQAILIFKKSNNFEGLIQCYIETKDWISLFQLLIKNNQLIHKFQSLKITTDCIKQVLDLTVNCDNVKNQQKSFRLFSRLKNVQKRQFFDQSEGSHQIKTISLESQYYYWKKMQQNLLNTIAKRQQLEKQINNYKIQINQLRQSEKKLENSLNLILSSKAENLSYKQQIEKLCLQLTFNKQLYPQAANQIQERLKHFQNQLKLLRKKQQKQKQYQKNIWAIQMQIQEVYKLQKKLQNQYFHLKKYYNPRKTQQGLQLVSKMLKQSIYSLNNNISNQKGKNPIKISVHDLKDFILNDPIDQENDINIGGFLLYPQQKRDMIQQIKEKLRISQKFIIQFADENNYSFFHHKFIDQRVFKTLFEKSASESYEIFLMMKKCKAMELNKICLLFCDFYKQLTLLSPQFILGYLLQFSKNFKQNRHFSDEIYQIKVLEEQEEINIALPFLQSLNKNGLLHKIPRSGFQNKIFYETILSKLVFGLILQGYWKELLIFCKTGQACKLAYLFSSQDTLVQYVRKISQQLGFRDGYDKKYLFTQDERVLFNYPEASVINIFSYQNIFYAYDQCQAQPFLSKTVKAEQVDISQELIRQFDDKSDQKILNIEREKQLFKQRSQSLQRQINICKAIIKNPYYQYNQDKYKKQLYEEIISRKQNQLNNVKQNIEDIQKQVSNYRDQGNKRLFWLNQNTVSTRQRKLYQKKVHQLLFKIQHASQGQKNALINERMKLDQQYKLKKQEQQEAKQNYERLRVRIQKKDYQINILKQSKIEIEQQIKRIKSKNFTDYEIKTFFNNRLKMLQKQQEKIQQRLQSHKQIKDKKQLKDKILRMLIEQQQNNQLSSKRQSQKKKTLENIKKNSNIPKSAHFKYLNFYMKDQIHLRNQMVYHRILVDGINIDLIEKKIQCKESQENISKNHANSKIIQQVNSIKMCNIIVFYLSYIFNRQIRQKINQFAQKSIPKYDQNIQKNKQYSNQISTIEKEIKYLKKDIQNTPQALKIKANRQYNNNVYKLGITKAKLQQFKQMRKQYQDFTMSPMQTIKKFLKIIYSKIQTINISQIHFMEILFGFFQCRIIRNCQTLGCFQNQYVLAKSNSIVIEKLQAKQKCDSDTFAYYFDQQNQTVLCRLQDIRSIILGIISDKHNPVINEIYGSKYQESIFEQKRYYNKESFGVKERLEQRKQQRKDTSQNNLILDLVHMFYFANQNYPIKEDYNRNFVGGQLLREVKNLKREALKYLLGKKHEKMDQFFLANHQIRQYYFIQQMIKQMKYFNYQTIREIRKKKDLLQEEFNKYISAQN